MIDYKNILCEECMKKIDKEKTSEDDMINMTSMSKRADSYLNYLAAKDETTRERILSDSITVYKMIRERIEQGLKVVSIDPTKKEDYFEFVPFWEKRKEEEKEEKENGE